MRSPLIKGQSARLPLRTRNLWLPAALIAASGLASTCLPEEIGFVDDGGLDGGEGGESGNQQTGGLSSGGSGPGGASSGSSTSGAAGAAGRGSGGGTSTGGTSGDGGSMAGGGMSVGGTAGSAGNAGGSPGGASGVGGAAPSICANPTFAFCDDFEDGDADGWMVEEGNWIVDTDGSRVYVGSPPNGYIGGTFLSTAGSTSWADQIVQATIKVIRFEQALSKRLASADRTEREAPDVVEQTGPSGAGIFARQQGSDFYTFQIDALGDLRLTRGSGPLSGTGSCGTVMNALTTDRWYTLRLEVTGTSQQQRHLVTWLSTDGTNFTQVHDCTLSGMGQPQNGGAGLILVASADGSEAAITAAFDDFTVTAP